METVLEMGLDQLPDSPDSKTDMEIAIPSSMHLKKSNTIVQMYYLLNSGLDIYGKPLLVFTSALHGLHAGTKDEWECSG